MDAAQRAVDGTVLKAPADGTVASVSAKVGDTVTGTNGTGSSGGSGGGNGGSSGNSASSSAGSSSTLSGFVVLTNPSGMQVTASFSEADALKLKPGQPATVTLNAMSGKTLNAQVLSVSSLPLSSGSSSGGGNAGGGSAVQYSATLTITSPTSDLRSGLSTSIQVVVGEASGALSVPAAAVSGTGENRTVTVVKADGTTVRTPVTLGLEGDSADQVVSGLTEGEQVQLAPVSSAGNGGFPSGTFPGGAGAAAPATAGARACVPVAAEVAADDAAAVAAPDAAREAGRGCAGRWAARTRTAGDRGPRTVQDVRARRRRGPRAGRASRSRHGPPARRRTPRGTG